MARDDAEPAPIPEEELGRLIRILGMLGSASAGERAAAALKAAEWVKAHQTDWQTLLLPPVVVNPVVSVGVGDVPRPAPQKPVQPAQAYPSPYAPNVAAAVQAAMAQQAAVHNPYTGGLGNSYAQAGWTNFNTVGNVAGIPAGAQPNWQTAAVAVLTHFTSVLKGPKELDFVKSLLARGWPKLTDKQADWLRDICGRAGLSW